MTIVQVYVMDIDIAASWLYRRETHGYEVPDWDSLEKRERKNYINAIDDLLTSIARHNSDTAAPTISEHP